MKKTYGLVVLHATSALSSAPAGVWYTVWCVVASLTTVWVMWSFAFTSTGVVMLKLPSASMLAERFSMRSLAE
ncbi:hypothetical protein, partial [Hydrogenophaga sp.]|uniref:hypothetical protein n=1 Tax=Hydrogenophaga sp. TaxID=1904254 RepID=UPI003AF4FAB1